MERQKEGDPFYLSETRPSSLFLPFSLLSEALLKFHLESIDNFHDGLQPDAI